MEQFGGVVVHMVLLWEGAIFWGNCGAHGVIVVGSIIGGIVVKMILLWQGALLGELW
jgi:hypothetical protein